MGAAQFNTLSGQGRRHNLEKVRSGEQLTSNHKIIKNSAFCRHVFCLQSISNQARQRTGLLASATSVRAFGTLLPRAILARRHH